MYRGKLEAILVAAVKPTQAVSAPTIEGMSTSVQVLVKQLDPGQEPAVVTS
jgi:hypothetical protein